MEENKALEELFTCGIMIKGRIGRELVDILKNSGARMRGGVLSASTSELVFGYNHNEYKIGSTNGDRHKRELTADEFLKEYYEKETPTSVFFAKANKHYK